MTVKAGDLLAAAVKVTSLERAVRDLRERFLRGRQPQSVVDLKAKTQAMLSAMELLTVELLAQKEPTSLSSMLTEYGSMIYRIVTDPI